MLKNGQIVHQAKIVVGKAETQTVLFSANMRYVVFHPEWGVPDSIKVKEILPYLRPDRRRGFFGFFGGTDTRVLQKHNLRVSFNGRPVDACAGRLEPGRHQPVHLHPAGGGDQRAGRGEVPFPQQA